MLQMMAVESDSDSVVLEMKISEAADIRKTDSQDTEVNVNEDPFDETGHGDPNAPVRVESWRTLGGTSYFTGTGTWYSYDSGTYAFGWEYFNGNGGWLFTEFNPEDIENGVYDAGGTKPTLKDANDNYLFIGNHTRFHIATNYRPYVNFYAPEFLVNGNSRIKVKQIQIGWNFDKYAVIPGGNSQTIYNHQCSPGNYSTNQFAIFAVIEMPEEWWTLESGEYLGTAVLTLQSP